MNTHDNTTKHRRARTSVSPRLHGRWMAALAVLVAVTAAAPSAWASVAIQSDTTAPVLHIPSYAVADATSPAGAIVAYRASAIDEVDGVVAVTCAPPPLSLFSIGDSIVICSARDSAGNTAAGSFNVHVKGAVEQIVNLMAVVSAIGPSAVGLNPILNRALLAVKAGQTSHACDELATFANAVYDMARHAQLTLSQATHLIDTARRIRSVIGC